MLEAGADGRGLDNRREPEIGEKGGDLFGRRENLFAPLPQVRPERDYDYFPTQRVGRTAPCVRAPSALRPSRSSRPATI